MEPSHDLRGYSPRWLGTPGQYKTVFMDEIPRGVYPALDAGLGMTILETFVAKTFRKMRIYTKLSFYKEGAE
jgi:hypothetical protein